MHLTLKLMLWVAGLGCTLARDYGVSTACTANSVNACLQPFVDKYGPQDQTTLLARSNVEHITAMCQDFTKARQCLDRFIHRCDQGTRRVFQGVEDMYDYVCGEGMPLMLRNQECMESPALVAEVTVCNNTAQAKVQEIQQKLYQYQMSAYFGGSNSEDIDRLKAHLCSVMQELMQCMRDSLLDHCGQEAATFVMTATQLVVEPAMAEIDCDVHSWGLLDAIDHNGESSEDRGQWPYDSKSSSSSSSEEEGDGNDDWWKEHFDAPSTPKALERLPVPSDTHSYTCTGMEIQQCVQPFIDRYGLQDQTALFARSATRDEAAMRQVCRDFSSVKRCLNGFLSRCEESSRKIFKGLYDMYDYTCGDGLYLYLAHQQCFARPDLEQELRGCNSTAANSYKDIQDHMTEPHGNPDVNKMKKELCRTTQNLMSCMKHSVKKHCGSEAAEFATTVVNKMLGPTMEEVDCKPKMSFTAWLAVAVAIGLLLVAVLVVCLRLYVRHRRRQTRRMRHHEAIVDGQLGQWDDCTVYRDTTAPLPGHGDAPPAYSDVSQKDTEPMLSADSSGVHKACQMTPPPPPYSSFA